MLPNFVEIDDSLATGAQPSLEGIKELKERGYSAILNLSPSSTPNFLDEEGRTAERLGFKYIHYPVDCSTLHEYQYRIFSGTMNGLKGEKTFIHCGGNVKSSGLLHLYQVLEEKRDESESYEDLLKAQNPDEKWLAYFQSFGLNRKTA